MKRTIRRATVIGAGVMGSQIAAHLANAGIDCLLLDRAPERLTEDETRQGLTAEHPGVRNRLAAEALSRLLKQKPAPLYDNEFVGRITPGNLDDDLPQIAEADWIIEAVVERAEIKREVLAKVEAHWTPGTIVSTNTSGISVNGLARERGEAFRKHFLGTHFFNPPRYMKLVELIPCADTDPEALGAVRDWCSRKLGKTVVVAKDTPNFVANRIGTFGLLVTLEEMLRGGYAVEEADAVTGPALGRPKSATFRTLDLVGLDTFVHVAGNMYEQAADAEEKERFRVPELLARMTAAGMLGEKAGRGFYWKKKGPAGSEIWSLNPDTLDYAPQRSVSSPSLEAAKRAKGAAGKARALLAGGDRYAALAWSIVKRTLLYAAEKAGEIADSIADVDEAMRSGFNWELGPFELWDALGLQAVAGRMEAEGDALPEWVRGWIAAGHSSFYERRDGVQHAVYGLAGRPESRPLEREPENVSLRELKESGRVVRANGGASLIDLGDGVACLEFHSPNNAIGADILQMIGHSLDEVRHRFEGLVIANQGKNFCVGANLMLLLMEAQDEEWDEVDAIIRLFQQTMLRLKYFEKPVVAAPHRMTLGGGVEACLPADLVVASAETYYGLVEVGVGLIPAGGGCKEMALRAAQAARAAGADLQPALLQAFETIGMAKVSTSGHDAIKLGLLRPTDRIVVNGDYAIHEAKQAVLRLAQAGYEPQREARFPVAGADGKAVMRLAAYTMRQGGYISDHDLLIAEKLAHVLAGGDLPAGTPVSEQYMLDLEREAFLSLCGEPKTQQRMQHMLATGKPLRN